MNKAEREQLKHNEAVDAIVSANSYLSQHGRTLGLAAVAVLLLVGSVFGYRAFKARTEERAHGQLAAAVAILNAPVTTATCPRCGTRAWPCQGRMPPRRPAPTRR